MLSLLLLTVAKAEETGCCYDVGFGAMMRECCQSMSDVHAGGLLQVGASECNTDSRMGGETRFASGQSCDEFDWYVAPEEESMGCCYDVGYGSMMVECCQSVTEAHDGGLLQVGKSQCNTEGRMGGDTKFAEGKSCDEFEWYEAPEEESMGCCYSLGFGSEMKPCCQNPVGDHDENWMIAESECETMDLMGGAVRFEADSACTDLEWGAELEQPEEARGCCYSVGHGAMMVECCQEPLDGHSTEDWMMAASECGTEDRMGGETIFAEGKACTDFEWGADLEVDTFNKFDDFKGWCATRDKEEKCQCGKWKSKKGKAKCIPPKKDKKVKCKKIKDTNLCKRVGCNLSFKKGKAKCGGKHGLM